MNVIPKDSTADQLTAAEAAKADADRARHATIQALLALRGYELMKVDGGPWIIRRWGLCKDLPTLDAVEAFGRTVGAIQ